MKTNMSYLTRAFVFFVIYGSLTCQSFAEEHETILDRKPRETENYGEQPTSLLEINEELPEDTFEVK